MNIIKHILLHGSEAMKEKGLSSRRDEWEWVRNERHYSCRAFTHNWECKRQRWYKLKSKKGFRTIWSILNALGREVEKSKSNKNINFTILKASHHSQKKKNKTNPSKEPNRVLSTGRWKAEFCASFSHAVTTFCLNFASSQLLFSPKCDLAVSQRLNYHFIGAVFRIFSLVNNFCAIKIGTI